MVKLHAVYPPASETKFVHDEPVWDDVEVTEDNYTSELLRGLNWHNYCATDKNYRKYLEEWIKTNYSSNSKSLVSSLGNTKKVNPTTASLARMNLRKFPLSQKHMKLLEEYIHQITNIKKSKVKTQNNTAKVSVQDAMLSQLNPVFAEIDYFVDEAFGGELLSAKAMMNKIFEVGSGNIKGPHTKLIIRHIETYMSEWNAVVSGEDPDLNEGYSFIKARYFKKIIDEFNALIDSLSRHGTSLKTQRISRKRPVDKKKMASKIKYMDNFPELELSSEDPVNIIGADIVWIYDTKKRKLGYYEAEVKNSLYVKGATIYGWKNSCEKILRKPEEQLVEFKKLRKNQTVNWFNDIRAKCKDMTGRTNSNLIILRVN